MLHCMLSYVNKTLNEIMLRLLCVLLCVCVQRCRLPCCLCACALMLLAAQIGAIANSNTRRKYHEPDLFVICLISEVHYSDRANHFFSLALTSAPCIVYCPYSLEGSYTSHLLAGNMCLLRSYHLRSTIFPG
jgi:hypothetical protein